MSGRPAEIRTARGNRRVSAPAQARIDAPNSHEGFLVTSGTFDLLYANTAALRILGFPRPSAQPALVARQLRVIFAAPSETAQMPCDAAFVSGRRTYTCRPFLLDHQSHAGSARPRRAMLGVLIDRPSRKKEEAPSDARQRFHLSPREFESAQCLVRGLTTKEVAECMHVSPNTVKQYVRLVMSKMGVTTRAGIVGKLLSA
jgi:DNA-binding CsgD family transcriptional regulator